MLSDRVIIGSTLGVVGVLIAIGLSIIACLIRNRVTVRSEAKGREEAKSMISKAARFSEAQMKKDCPVIYAALALDAAATKAAEFKKEAEKVSAMKSATALAYLESIRYKSARVVKVGDTDVDVGRVVKGELIASKRSLHPEYEVCEASQVAVGGVHIREKDRMSLSANWLSDLFDQDFIMAQTPSLDHYEFHWEMIWQKKVGVVVWIGHMRSSNWTEPYVSDKEGDRWSYGRFEARTTSALSYKRMFTLFKVRYRNKKIYQMVDIHGQQNREIILINIESWPDKPNKPTVENIALVVEMVRSTALQQKEIGLPGVLVHCSTGVEFTCAFAGMYLCRQMYLRFNAVNVKGVLKMIGRVRYKAFSSKDAFHQIQLVHAVVLELIEKFPRQKLDSSLKVEKFEQHLLRLPSEIKKPAAVSGGTVDALLDGFSNLVLLVERCLEENYARKLDLHDMTHSDNSRSNYGNCYSQTNMHRTNST